MTIRTAEIRDVSQVCHLIHQLGYDTPEVDIREAIRQYRNIEGAFALVVEENDEIVGLVSAHICPYFHRKGALIRVTSIVVKDQCRRHGVAKLLLEEAERIGQESGCDKIELTSSNSRAEEAHLFYEKMGFTPYNGKRFTKQLPNQRMNLT